MIRLHTVLVAPCIAALLLHGAANATEPHAIHAHEHALGSVRVVTSCSAAAAPDLERGLALLHHMTYDVARQAFARAAATDPGCAMSEWGEAMTYIHPLWSDPPAADDFRRAEELLRSASGRKWASTQERAYIDATLPYFRQGRSESEAANLSSFANGWRRAHERDPQDPEAAAFYALALLGTADPADKSYARQRQAAGLLADVGKRIPDHPATYHYLIHAFDYPPLANQALAAARGYAEIAPDVPHALHMPTHIFTRMGSWKDSIAWNRRSAAAALKQPVGGRVSLHYLHALDYLVYAHLQLGQDWQAREVLRDMNAIDGPMQVELAVPYALAAIPARLALERQQWRTAATLPPRIPGGIPWDRFPAMEAVTWFARALGAAHVGDTASAQQAIDRLDVLHAAAAKTSAYWAAQVAIQRAAAAAWLAHTQGDDPRALMLMRDAARQEAATEKHPVTPGEVLPASELLGDLLLVLERPGEARAAYEASLARSPNRLNSLAGVAHAADLAGDTAAATGYYRRLMALAGESGAALAPMQRAKHYLEGSQVVTPVIRP